MLMPSHSLDYGSSLPPTPPARCDCRYPRLTPHVSLGDTGRAILAISMSFLGNTEAPLPIDWRCRLCGRLRRERFGRAWELNRESKLNAKLRAPDDAEPVEDQDESKRP